jgi:hypothetical protein
MLRTTFIAAVLVVAAVALTGCTSYYKVTDPESGKTYYSTKVTQLKDGATKLEDERSKTEVTIQNSQVQKITKEQYEAAVQGSPSTHGM